MEEGSVIDAEQVSRQMEEDLIHMKTIQPAERQVHKLKEVMFKASQELFNHRQEVLITLQKFQVVKPAKNLNHRFTS